MLWWSGTGPSGLREHRSGNREAAEPALMPHLQMYRCSIELGSSYATKHAAAASFPSLLHRDAPDPALHGDHEHYASPRARGNGSALMPGRCSPSCMDRRESAG
ncbi:hypothetical protein SBBP2_2400028 [Burkholderiales bacterium]|nr:hypothetical protein SBBP2_2400028 [Burkholderiales bacterium]